MEAIIKNILRLLVGVIGIIFLLNFGAGIVAEIPDNTPIVGNIDEVIATLVTIWAFKLGQFIKG